MNGPPAGSTLFTGLPLVVDESNNYEKYARGLGSDLQIPLLELAKSDALVERSPDTIEKKTVIVEDGVSLRIEERQFLQSKLVRVLNLFSPHLLSLIHVLYLNLTPSTFMRYILMGLGPRPTL